MTFTAEEDNKLSVLVGLFENYRGLYNTQAPFFRLMQIL